MKKGGGEGDGPAGDSGQVDGRAGGRYSEPGGPLV